LVSKRQKVTDRMSICDVLANNVKRELNLLLWEDPFIIDGGSDAGWFCREHALLVSAVAEMLGHRTQVAVGDYAIVTTKKSLTSIGAGSDHAWNIIDAVDPVDASLSVRHLFPNATDVLLVCPDHPELRSHFNLVSNAPLDPNWIAKRRADGSSVIAYREERRIESDILDLLREPYAFLHPPPRGAPTFTEAFGDDVIHAIAWHALLVHRGVARRIDALIDSDRAITAIYRLHPNARMNVEREIYRQRRAR
jgi:hypothetical protein